MKKLIGSLFIFLMLVAGCGSMDGRYDYAATTLHRSAKSLGQIRAAIYRVHLLTMLRPKGALDEVPGPKQQYGAAFSVDGKYLITNRHVVEPPSKMTVPLPFGGQMDVDMDVVSCEYYIMDGDEKVTLECRMSTVSDVAILWKEGYTFKKLPARIGNSDELELGHLLIFSFTPYGVGHQLAQSTVGSLELWSMVTEEFGAGKDWGFMAYTSPAAGDSGNPVFAVRDGKLELVGICEGTMVGGGVTGAIVLRSNHALDCAEVLIEVNDSMEVNDDYVVS